MKTATASTRTEGLLKLFDMQTAFLERAIVGISVEDTYSRLNTKANHIAWLTGSLVSQRFLMASDMNSGLVQTGAELFKDNKGIQENTEYPTADIYLKDWNEITPVAREAIITMDDAKLDSEMDMGFMKMTYYDLLAFTIYREASIIGQIALWRRLLDYPAMKYD